MQLTAADPVMKVFSGHGSQSCEPGIALNFPGGHASQVSDATVPEYPGGHWQSCLLEVPGGDTVCTSETVGQTVQNAAAGTSL